MVYRWRVSRGRTGLKFLDVALKGAGGDDGIDVTARGRNEALQMNSAKGGIEGETGAE